MRDRGPAKRAEHERTLRAHCPFWSTQSCGDCRVLAQETPSVTSLARGIYLCERERYKYKYIYMCIYIYICIYLYLYRYGSYAILTLGLVMDIFWIRPGSGNEHKFTEPQPSTEPQQRQTLTLRVQSIQMWSIYVLCIGARNCC